MTQRQLIVQKYGGTSLADADRIRRVAARIAGRANAETRVIVTVSAMGESTDELLRLAYDISPSPPQRELDMLLTVGERISMALLSMALNAAGCPAISFTGSQSGIVTDVSHTRALIEEIRATRIETELDRGKVVIVAGFQGVSREKEITTLGRGGSDTTAVAIAAALKASRCEIYSDFPGIFTADPRSVASARAVPRIAYDEMLELAARGARVLHYRAAEIARRYRVPLYLLSSFEDGQGTTVEEAPMEHAQVTSITSRTDVSVVRCSATRSGVLDTVVERLCETDLQIWWYHHEFTAACPSLVLLMHGDDVTELRKRLGNVADDLVLETRDDLATVSVVGSGFACNARAVFNVERLLAGAGIPVTFSTNSPLSVTCVVARTDCERAVGALHAGLFPNP